MSFVIPSAYFIVAGLSSLGGYALYNNSLKPNLVTKPVYKELTSLIKKDLQSFDTATLKKVETKEPKKRKYYLGEFAGVVTPASLKL